LYALQKGLPLPIGTQSAEMLDPGVEDEDADSLDMTFEPEEQLDMVDSESGEPGLTAEARLMLEAQGEYEQRARVAYELYRTRYANRFKWMRPALFLPELANDLRRDALALGVIAARNGRWNPQADRKLAKLTELLTVTHAGEKVLIFTQFSDTAHYLAEELKRRGVTAIEAVTGHTQDPTAPACRFSPRSNEKACAAERELRVLVATDVLSEGQNLQDAHVVVNYDLPWAIIRLIQRAGRVDRIGQKAPKILAYSFLPETGVEEIIHLRKRVSARLRANSEVLGSDEQFFEDEQQAQDLRDLYTEKAGALDDENDSEVDLVSRAQAIWEAATRDNPALARRIEALPNQVYSTRGHAATEREPDGVLVYVRTADDADALAWVDARGRTVTTSQLAILRAAECAPDTAVIPRDARHHDLVKTALERISQEERQTGGGQLGAKTGARYRAYNRLKAHIEELRRQSPLLVSDALVRVLDDLIRFPLKEGAKDQINRQIKLGATDEALAQLCLSLREEDRLSLPPSETEQGDDQPRIVCSMGLF
jgi:hypothetical protein